VCVPARVVNTFILVVLALCVSVCDPLGVLQLRAREARNFEEAFMYF